MTSDVDALAGDFFYVIKSGCVVFQVNGTDVGKAKAGASFGELSLLYTVRAVYGSVSCGPSFPLWSFDT
jgi:CRP-like cAMP-binding protein